MERKITINNTIMSELSKELVVVTNTSFRQALKEIVPETLWTPNNYCNAIIDVENRFLNMYGNKFKETILNNSYVSGLAVYAFELDKGEVREGSESLILPFGKTNEASKNLLIKIRDNKIIQQYISSEGFFPLNNKDIEEVLSFVKPNYFSPDSKAVQFFYNCLKSDAEKTYDIKEGYFDKEGNKRNECERYLPLFWLDEDEPYDYADLFESEGVIYQNSRIQRDINKEKTLDIRVNKETTLWGKRKNTQNLIKHITSYDADIRNNFIKNIKEGMSIYILNDFYAKKLFNKLRYYSFSPEEKEQFKEGFAGFACPIFTYSNKFDLIPHKSHYDLGKSILCGTPAHRKEADLTYFGKQSSF